MPLPRASVHLWLRIFSLILLVVGPALVFSAVGWGIYQAWISHHSDHARGVVLASQQQVDASGRVLFHPRITFKAANGRQYEAVSLRGTTLPVFRAGQSVPVTYRIDNPSSAFIDTAGERWDLIMMLGGAGACLTYLALWLRQRSAVSS